MDVADALPLPMAESKAASPQPQPQSAGRKGYPLSIMEKQPDERFICSWCHELLRSPMQNSCGHRFCQVCKEEMRSHLDSLICQACKDEGMSDEESRIKLNEIFDDKAARREMKKLDVKCVFAGCVWKGNFYDYIEHEENCDRRMVNCSQCGVNVSKGKLGNHEAKTCPKRIAQCQHCTEDIVHDVLDIHTKTCPKFIIKCEGCGMKVERQELTVHEEQQCSNRMVVCPLPTCNARLPMSKFSEHLQKQDTLSKHIVYLLENTNFQHNLNTRLQELEVKAGQRSGGHGSPTASAEETTLVKHMVAQAVPVSNNSGALDVAGLDAAEGGRMQGDGADTALLQTEAQQKLKLHEDLMSVLHAEILRCITKGEALERELEKEDKRVRDLYSKVDNVLQTVALIQRKYNEVCKQPFNEREYGQLSSDGDETYTWRIDEFSGVRRGAYQGDRDMVCSPIFPAAPGGYRVRLQLYSNGRGPAKGKSLSVFLEVLQGPSDELLVWPFAAKVYFMLVDQKSFVNHHTSFVMAGDDASSPKRPTEISDGNVVGLENFISIEKISSSLAVFLPRDVMFIKVCMELSQKGLDRMNALNPRKLSTTMS